MKTLKLFTFIPKYLWLCVWLNVVVCNGNMTNEEIDDLYEPNSLWDKLDGKIDFETYILRTIEGGLAIWGHDIDVHRYERQSDLLASFRNESKANLMDECGNQMNSLLIQTKQLYSNQNSFSKSKKLALIYLLDSWASVSPQLMSGSFWWLGAYEQCLRAKFEKESARYCVAKLRLESWRQNSIEHLKLGLCLPSNCNSYSIGSSLDKLAQVIRLSRLQGVPYNQLKLDYVYCLPDKDSDLRKYSFSAWTLVLLLSSWLCLVLICTLRYEFLVSQNGNANRPVDNFTKALAFTLNFNECFK